MWPLLALAGLGAAIAYVVSRPQGPKGEIVLGPGSQTVLTADLWAQGQDPGNVGTLEIIPRGSVLQVSHIDAEGTMFFIWNNNGIEHGYGAKLEDYSDKIS